MLVLVYAGYGRIEVHIIEAWMTVTPADATRRTELWRLMTSLLDAEPHPAEELIALYHRRWQAETCYFSLNSTIPDGRVLRSRTVPGIEQEVYALLTVYQALIRLASDLVTARPELPARRSGRAGSDAERSAFHRRSPHSAAASPRSRSATSPTTV